jgi:hypothetical protein
MNKIKGLQLIVDDNTISFSEKLDKVRSNQMDLAMLLLLLGETHEFEQAFPLKLLESNPDLINDYRDPSTDQIFFKTCLNSKEMVVSLLNNISLAKQINEITDNGILIVLNKNHNDEEFIKTLLDHNLLDRYITFESLSNQFFNVNFEDQEYFKKLMDFIESNSSFFTLEYFDGFDINEPMKPFLFPYLKNLITTNTDILSFCKSYCNEDLLLNEIIPHTTLDLFILILNELDNEYSDRLLSIRRLKNKDGFSNIESRIVSNIQEIIKDHISKQIIEKIENLISEDNFRKLLDSIFNQYPIDTILNSQWIDESILLNGLTESQSEKMNLFFIKNGDYSKITSIENLISAELSQKQLKIALYDFLVENNWDSLDSNILNKIPFYSEIKEELASKLFKNKIFSSYSQYLNMDLSSEWHLKNSKNEYIIELIREQDEIQLMKILNNDKEIMKERIMQAMKTDSFKYTSDATKQFIFSFIIKNSFQTDSELLSMLNKDNFDLDDIMEVLPESIILLLLQQKKNKTNIHFLKSEHTPQKIKDEMISKLSTYDIYGYQRHHWMGSELTSEQLDSIWTKVSDQDNRTLKDFMFDFIRIYKTKASKIVMDEIIKRASKLKGFEDVIITEIDPMNFDPAAELKLLSKKFTKAISNAKSAKESLTDVDFLPLLNESNILRIFKKMSDASCHEKVDLIEAIKQKKYPFDQISFRLTDDSLSLLLSNGYKNDDLIFAILCDESISTTFKINLVKTSNIYRLSKIPSDILNNFDLKLIICLLDYVANKEFVLSLNKENQLKLLKSASNAKILLLVCDGLKTNKEYKELASIILKNNTNAFKNKAFISKIIDSIEVIDENNIIIVDLLIEHAPLQFFDKQKHAICHSMDSNPFTKKLARELLLFQSKHDKDQFKMSLFIENMSLFSNDELNQIVSILTEENYNDLNTKYALKYINSEMSPLHKSILVNDRTKSWLPLELWTMDLFQSDLKPSADQWIAFLNSKGLNTFLIKLTTKEKELITDSLLEYDPNSSNRGVHNFLDNIKTIYDNKKYLNISDKQLDLLWLKVNSDLFTKMLQNLGDFSFLLNKLSPESKNLILTKFIEIINTNEDIEIPTYLFTLLPIGHELRTNLISNAKSRNSIDYILQSIITEHEVDLIVTNIITNTIKIAIDHDKGPDYPCIQMLMPKLINAYIEFDFYLVAEHNGALEIKAPLHGYRKILGSDTTFHELLTNENIKKIKHICSNLNTIYPERIPGSFNLEENKFIIDKSVSVDKKVIELITKQNKFESDINTSDLIDGLMSFGKIKKVKAHATRFFDYNNQIDYLIKIEFDSEQLEFKTRLYDQEVLNLLNKKETEIEEIINEKLQINNQRTFGFELEFSSNKSKNDISNFLKENKEILHPIIVHNAYLSSNGKSWDFKMDASVNATIGFSMELASPILTGDEGITESKEVLNSIFNNFKIDTSEDVSGGLHVHHDIKDLLSITEKKSELLEKFHLFQESLYSICAYHRNNESYCEKISMKSINKDNEFGRIGFNVSAYNTMEFRMRESLGDVSSIIRWITITQQVVDSVSFGLKDQLELFHKTAVETLESIQLEKAMQLKKMTNNQQFMNELDRYNQARIFSDLMLSKQLTN